MNLSEEERQKIEVALRYYGQHAKLSQVSWELIYRANPNLVVRVKDDFGERYILKIPRDQDTAEGYCREAYLMKLADSRLAKHLSVPTHIVYNHDPPYLAYREVEGRIIKWKELLSKDHGRRDAIGAKLGKVIASWHTTPSDELRGIALPRGPNPNDVPSRLLQAALNKVEEDSRIRPSLKVEFSSATDAMSKSWSVNGGGFKESAQSRLLHNDINANNFIFDGSDDLFGLIDFGNARVDDAHADFKFLCYRDWDHLGTSAINAYQSESELEVNWDRLRFQAILAGLSVVVWGETVENSSRSDDVTEFLGFCGRNEIN